MSNPKQFWMITSIVSLLVGSSGGAGTVYYLGRTIPEITRPMPFTSIDGQKLHKELEALRTRLALIENRELPPLWLKKEVSFVKERTELNEARIREFREEQSRRTPMIKYIEGRMQK